MKLITCNIWGGIVYEPLIEFIKKHSADTDIFCFQEVLFGEDPNQTAIFKARENIFNEISAILPDFVAYKYLSPSKHFQSEIIDFPEGQAIFVRKSIKVNEDGGFRAYKVLPIRSPKGGRVTGSCQWVGIKIGESNLTILNLHGIWLEGVGKEDTSERIEQSKIIKDFLSKRNGKKIICGDFNLNIDGESIKILEQGMKNLVRDYGITSTRSSFYPKEDKFADYVLVSPDIKVSTFKVFPDEVSDHLPLMVEFD